MPRKLGQGRLPAQLPADPARIGDQPGRVAGTAVGIDHRETSARHFPDGLDHLKVRVPGAAAKVVSAGLDAVHRRQGQQVGVGNVGHVDIVANARSIGRVVIGSEQAQAFPLAQGRRQGNGNQMRLAFARLRRSARWRRRR